MPTFRILYRLQEAALNDQYLIIGDGFQSGNAVWLALVQETNRIIADKPRPINFIIERYEFRQDGEVITARVGHLYLDANGMFDIPVID